MYRIAYARLIAERAHGKQMYGNRPYVYHLERVAEALSRFGYTDSHYQEAAYLHDTLEDTAVKYHELAEHFDEEVVQMVWACTGEGKNRKEKQAAIKLKLLQYVDAVPVEAADRIANLEECLGYENVDKIRMYAKEGNSFMESVFEGISIEMSTYLTELIDNCRAY